MRAGAVDLILKSPDSVAYLKERVLDAAGRSVGKREVDDVLGDIKTVHDAFERARAHCKLLAQDLFDADVALQLRAKSGPPAGPLFEQEAKERAAADRAELER